MKKILNNVLMINSVTEADPENGKKKSTKAHVTKKTPVAVQEYSIRYLGRSRAVRYVNPPYALNAPHDQGFVSVQYFTNITDPYPLCVTVPGAHVYNDFSDREKWLQHSPADLIEEDKQRFLDSTLRNNQSTSINCNYLIAITIQSTQLRCCFFVNQSIMRI
jgi:hypothetical protein